MVVTAALVRWAHADKAINQEESNNEAAKKKYFLASLAVLLSPMAANSQTVTVNATGWMQPADTVNISWFDIAAICDEITGACNGALGTVDLAGWTWASIEDVAAMFALLTPHTGDWVTGEAFERDSAWAPAFLAKFDPTDTDGTTYSYVRGITRTTNPFFSGSYQAGEVTDFLTPGSFDEAITTSTGDKTRAFASVGGWFYRAAAPTLSCVGFKAPADRDVQVNRPNRVVPLRMQLLDENGAYVGYFDSPPVLQAIYVGSSSNPGDLNDLDTAGRGDEGNIFVFDGTNWAFNLSTKGLAKGTYALSAVSGDQSEYVIDPTCEVNVVIK